MASNPYKTTGLLGWIDNRFPLTLLWHDHMDRYYAAKNFNFWYLFGSLALSRLGEPNSHRRLAGDVLQTERRRSLQQRRIHHARR